MSGILGLQRQKQALQTGQYQQQTAEAESQNATRVAQEKQRIAAYVSNPANKGKKAADMADDIRSIAPTVGPDYLTAQTGLEQKETELKASQSKLSAGNQELAGNLIGSLVGGTETPDQIAAKLDFAGRANPQIKELLDHYKDLVGHLPPPGQQRDALLNQAAVSLGAKSPLSGNLTDTGGQLTPTTKNENTGEVQATPGAAPIAKTLAPTEQIPYLRERAAAVEAGGKGAANDEDLYNTIQGQASQSAGIKSTAQDIKTLADEVKTGKYSKEKASAWTALEQSFGINPKDDSDTVRRQVLGKKVAQLRMQMELAQGASTDAARSNTDAALPDPDHVAPGAVKSAANDVIGMADRATARATLANNHRQNNGGQSGGLRAVDNAFMSSADPRVYTYKNLQPGAERQEFLKEHFKSRREIQDFLDKQSVLDHMTGSSK